MVRMPMPERIVVLGGAGFVGSHLCDRLVADGYDVVCLDNLSTSSRENIRHLTGDSRFTFVLQDVTEGLDVAGPFAGVFNLASPASPSDYLEHPRETLLANAFGMYHALELAARDGSRVVQASTAEVYGDPEVHPQPESYWGHVNPIGPRSVYDEGKRFAEALAAAYFRERRVDVRIARIFNTYGPRMRPGDGRVLSNFMMQALRSEPLTVYGDGKQTRSLCYVDDLVEGLVRLYRHPASMGQTPTIVNLGNPDEVQVIDLAAEIVELAGSSSTIVFRPLPEDDPKVRRPDINRARELLDWQPQVSRSDGLRRVLPYFRALAAEPASL